MTDDLTLIIPSFQRQELTERAILSVCRQSQKCQIIVVDDASVPPFKLPEDLANEQGIKIVRHEQNKGAAAARNTGILAASTTYITFLDSDDYLLEDTLSQRLKFAKSFPPEVITGCGWVDVREVQTHSTVRIPNSSASPDDFYGGCWFCPGSCVIFNRSLFVKTVGLFDEKYRRLEDVEWSIRFGQIGGQFKSINLTGVTIQHHAAKDADDIENATANLYADVQAQKIEQKQLRKLKAYLLLEHAASARRNGHPIKAALKMIYSLLLYPRSTMHLVPGWRVEKLPNRG